MSKKAMHNDLKSFLRYLSAGSIDQTHAVFRGTLYEYVVKDVLQQKFKKAGLAPLIRVGGAADGGVDLVGKFAHRHEIYIPELPVDELSLNVQCKSSASKVSSIFWRELAGAYAEQYSEKPALMLLASPAALTAKSRQSFNQMPVPLAYAQVRLAWPQYDLARNQLTCPVGLAHLRALNVNDVGSKLLLKYRIPWDS